MGMEWISFSTSFPQGSIPHLPSAGGSSPVSSSVASVFPCSVHIQIQREGVQARLTGLIAVLGSPEPGCKVTSGKTTCRPFSWKWPWIWPFSTAAVCRLDKCSTPCNSVFNTGLSFYISVYFMLLYVRNSFGISMILYLSIIYCWF